ncbi:hypothetical protein [Microbulbifer elongatus]|uniref:hypothetical protein n=1 Tax=Microbulbifer elongatus TaxID=86173 RepID=UPI001CFD2201|nr:hypothetical protein [Microbulbifer elongatus]
MEEIVKNISSISWWFGVVFVGVVVSLIAGYLKPRIDNWLANYSKSRKNRNEKEKQEWASEVSRLQLDDNYRPLFASRITHLHGRSNFFMLAGMSMFLISSVFSLLFQFPNMGDPKVAKEIATFISSLPEDKILFFIRLLTSLIGSISLLIGISYFKSSEKLQKQFEDAVEEVATR